LYRRLDLKDRPRAIVTQCNMFVLAHKRLRSRFYYARIISPAGIVLAEMNSALEELQFAADTSDAFSDCHCKLRATR
jgi:hypothetical protein